MLRIIPLAERPQAIEIVARWHWDEWGRGDPGGSVEGWTSALRERSNRDRIPVSWLALVDGEPVGSVTLQADDMATHPELSPWLSGLIVVPQHRGHGIGMALVRHCEAEAQRLGARRLFVYTTGAEPWYSAAGWTALAREPYGEEEVVVMAKASAGATNDEGHAICFRGQAREQAARSVR